ncbi:hypothetical protein ACB098_05G173000 [Castanea mollissima]
MFFDWTSLTDSALLLLRLLCAQPSPSHPILLPESEKQLKKLENKKAMVIKQASS